MKIIDFGDSRCNHCYKCLRSCDVKAIDILDCQAAVDESRCILCGRCLTVCPQDAKILRSDLALAQELIRSGRRTVLSLDPSYLGLFSGPDPAKTVGALRRLGFCQVRETAQGAACVTHDGAVVDVTEGTEVLSGEALAANHRYLVGEDTAAIFTVQSGWAQVGVQGSYTLSGGAENPTPFADVKRSDWYYDPVSYVYGNHLFSGMSEHAFGPGEPMTRAMLVTVLYQLAGAPQDELAAAGAQLTDVADGAWYASYVRWAVDHGIASGTGNGAFSPDGQVTREQVVVMLYSFAGGYLGLNTDLGADLSAFSDAGQVSSWAVEAMAWAVDRGVVSGSADAGGLSLNPGRSANRAEVAAMLRSFAESL